MSEPLENSGNLLRQRRFLPLFITQLLGALNDNVIKNAMVVLLTFQAAGWTTLTPGLLANLAAGIFILPFFLFSATAGQLADKYDKAQLARLVKLLEILIVLVAGAGFMARRIEILFVALFLLGLHSTLFGPIKYAILPQHLRADELVSGNALVEAGTFIAILGGTLLGGLLAAAPGATLWITLAGLLVASGGYFAARFIPVAVPPAPTLRVSRNPFTETWRNLAAARKNRPAFAAILGISWFWLYGALFLAQFPAYAKNILGGDETVVTLLLATFIIGIGAGSLLCARLSRHNPARSLALVLPGSLGLSVFAFDLYFASPAASTAGAPLSAWALLHVSGIWRILADLTLLGLCGGLFSVPLYTLLQQRSSVDHRARMVAANNICNALFMVVGALGAAALLNGGLSIPKLFGLAALCNAALCIAGARRLSELRRKDSAG